MSNAFLVENIRDAAPEISGARALGIVRNIVRGIQSTLDTRGEFRLSGVGTLRVIEQEARQGRNPQTGDPVAIPRRKVVRFRPSNTLSERVNETDGKKRKVKSS